MLVFCFVSPSVFVSFSKGKYFLCLMCWKEIHLKKILKNWKEINIFGGWLWVANGWQQQAKSLLYIKLGMAILNGLY